jgi:hypothetical protein
MTGLLWKLVSEKRELSQKWLQILSHVPCNALRIIVGNFAWLLKEPELDRLKPNGYHGQQQPNT